MSRASRIPPFVPEPVYAPDIALSPDDFAWVGPDPEEQEQIARPSTSYWRDALRRLFKSKVAVLCIAALILIGALSVAVPALSPYTISEQHVDHMNEGFFYKAEDGHVHLFGTDILGRDLFTRVFYGGQISLFIAFAAVLVNLVIGVLLGSIAGYLGGQVDNIMMRGIEILSAIPYLIIVILMMMVMRRGIGAVIAAYSVVGWIGMARLVRGQIISLKEREFVIAARALGAPAGRIIARHLVPNVLSVIIVNISLAIPSVIFTEAFLSLLGMGVPIPLASWGTLAQDGIRTFVQYPIQLAVPAVLISVTMLSFNLLGDGMRDAFDPRLRK